MPSAREVAETIVCDLSLSRAASGVVNDDALAKYLDDATDYIARSITAYAETVAAQEREKHEHEMAALRAERDALRRAGQRVVADQRAWNGDDHAQTRRDAEGLVIWLSLTKLDRLVGQALPENAPATEAGSSPTPSSERATPPPGGEEVKP